MDIHLLKLQLREEMARPNPRVIEKPSLSDWILFLSSEKTHYEAQYIALIGALIVMLSILIALLISPSNGSFLIFIAVFSLFVFLFHTCFFKIRPIFIKARLLLPKIMHREITNIKIIESKWFDTKKMNKKKKLFEVFDLSEKRAFVETLLVVSGIMTGFNSSPLKTSIFVTFASSSISYIIWISVLKKRLTYRKFTNTASIFNWMLSGLTGATFSALVFLVGIQANMVGIKTIWDVYTILGGWLTVYFMLGVLLLYVLAAYNPYKKSAHNH
jgi:MFS family permease